MCTVSALCSMEQINDPYTHTHTHRLDFFVHIYKVVTFKPRACFITSFTKDERKEIKWNVNINKGI